MGVLDIFNYSVFPLLTNLWILQGYNNNIYIFFFYFHFRLQPYNLYTMHVSQLVSTHSAATTIPLGIDTVTTVPHATTTYTTSSTYTTTTTTVRSFPWADERKDFTS